MKYEITRFDTGQRTELALQMISLYKLGCWTVQGLCFRGFHITDYSTPSFLFLGLPLCSLERKLACLESRGNLLDRESTCCSNFTLQEVWLFELNIRRNTNINLIIPCYTVQSLGDNHIQRRHMFPYCMAFAFLVPLGYGAWNTWKYSSGLWGICDSVDNHSLCLCDETRRVK
jgi:hypothetical protein